MITAQTFIEQMQHNADNTWIIEVRPKEECDRDGYVIGGSTFLIPFDRNDPNNWLKEFNAFLLSNNDRITDQTQLIFTCRSGARSKACLEMLAASNAPEITSVFEQCFNLDGGNIAVKTANTAVQAESSPYAPRF
jgi:rhodanese-related sulfurtransferase